MLRHARRRTWPAVAWCVVRGAWCVVRGAWRMVCHAWFTHDDAEHCRLLTDAKLEPGEDARCVECHARNHLSA
jgi:hypothetical protein